MKTFYIFLVLLLAISCTRTSTDKATNSLYQKKVNSIFDDVFFYKKTLGSPTGAFLLSASTTPITKIDPNLVTYELNGAIKKGNDILDVQSPLKLNNMEIKPDSKGVYDWPQPRPFNSESDALSYIADGKQLNQFFGKRIRIGIKKILDIKNVTNKSDFRTTDEDAAVDIYVPKEIILKNKEYAIEEIITRGYTLSWDIDPDYIGDMHIIIDNLKDLQGGEEKQYQHIRINEQAGTYTIQQEDLNKFQEGKMLNVTLIRTNTADIKDLVANDNTIDVPLTAFTKNGFTRTYVKNLQTSE